MLNENLISDEIRAKYVRDPRIPHPAELAVSERAGAVTLRGTDATPTSATRRLRSPRPCAASATCMTNLCRPARSLGGCETQEPRYRR